MTPSHAGAEPELEGRRSIDIVIPAYNEELCLDELARRLGAMFDSEPDYIFRAIIVENGSHDRSWPILQAIAEADERFVAVRLSRNFHMDGGLTAGLEFAEADAVVFMTADLQDPPEAIPEFIRKWEEGYDNVYGLVTKREGTGPIRKMNSQLFYWTANRMTSVRLPRNASDFRLMDRELYETLRSLDERNRFMRGLVAWAGFTSAAVEVPREPRFAGESKAYSIPVIGFAIRGILAHSYFPLRMISIFGLVAAFTSLIAFLVLAVLWFTKGVPFAGFGSLVSILLFGFAILTTMLGVMSEYLSLIYEEVKGRPNFVVREVLNVPRLPGRRPRQPRRAGRPDRFADQP